MRLKRFSYHNRSRVYYEVDDFDESENEKGQDEGRVEEELGDVWSVGVPHVPCGVLHCQYGVEHYFLKNFIKNKFKI